MTKKSTLTVFFILSLLPMFLNQYGGCRSVQEITGLINLLNPIGIVSIIAFFTGVWVPFKNDEINKILGAVGVIGIVISEIFEFLTWHIQTITGEMSLQNSFRLAYPEFYVGLVISIFMIVLYVNIDKFIKE